MEQTAAPRAKQDGHRIPDELFRQLVDSAPDAMVVVDVDGTISLVNLLTESLFGYSRRELLGQPIEILIPVRYHAAHAKHRVQFTDAPKPRPMGTGRALYGRRADATEFPIEISLSPLRVEGKLLVASAIRDVSERQRVEQAAKVASERLLSAIESFHGALSLYDADDRLTLCNSTSQALFGPLMSGPLVGSTHSDLVHACVRGGLFGGPDEADAVRSRLLAYHENPTGTFDLRLSHGVTLRLTSRRTLEGGIISTLVDVSDDAKLEAELRSARAEAEAASSAKSEFLSSMSHELRTPMNAILGFAQLLQRDKRAPLSPGQREKLDYVLQGGEHLLRLIDDVLDLSRIEAGRVVVSPEPIGVAELLRDVQQTLEPMAVRAGIRLSVDTSPSESLQVFADRTRCKQILINFGSNAVKYGKPNGSAQIRCERVDEGTVRLAVRDDGIGIPSEKQSKIFQPFQRAGQEGGPIEGTGIGLSITRRLAELMNGSVGFSSSSGQGSDFWLRLPLHGSSAVVSTEALSTAPRPVARVVGAPPETLLVYIEDNPSNIAFMQGVVDELPCVQLVSVPNAEVGIEVVRELQPRVVLMDINLPGMDGYEATKRLRECPETSDIPVVALTAAAMLGERSRLGDAGFIRYLTKPVKVAELIETLMPLLDVGF